jgi:uncharacterized RDD family membrane protein YckC
MEESTRTNKCPRCTHENTAGINYCGSCGLHIDGICPTCSTQNASSVDFCGNCGFDFSSPVLSTSLPDLRSHHASTAQRRQTLRSRLSRLEPLAIDCPRCNHITEPGAAFCFNCGLPLDGTTGFRQSPSIGVVPAYVGMRPGGFLIRFVALIIDSLITTAAVSVLTSLFTDVSPSDYMQGLDSSDGADFINWAFNFGYAPVLLGIWATTVGKRPFNMYVLKLDGTPVGFWRALGRETAKIISAIPLFAGFWMVAFRPDKRSLHDLISGTVVVHR